MTTYGVNQNFAPTGNSLCDKLKRQFAARGVAKTVQYKAPSTYVMVDRVQRGLDPYENAPNPLTEKRPETPKTAAPKTAAAKQPAQKTAASTASRPAAKAPVHKSAQKNTVKPMPVKTNTAVNRFGTDAKCDRSAKAAARDKKANVKLQEVRVGQAPFPFAAFVSVVIFGVILLSVLFAFVQNYELSGEIARLEAECNAIDQEEQILNLRLEERDDIRVIEDIAVNEIGMVKNDLVENRFVSVSGGNRVEISAPTEDEAQVENSVFSGMLSAIAENFAKLREYID